MKAARNSLPNFSDIAIPWRQRDPPQGNKPDFSGALLLSDTTLPSLFSVPLFLIFSALLFLLLCQLNAQGIPFLPAGKAVFPPQHIFWPIVPCSTHHHRWKG